MIYFFGEHELDTATFELRCHGQLLPLRHLPFRLLVHLIQRRPSAVSKAELVQHVWQCVHVDDGALRTAACDLRRALGQRGSYGPWVQTVPGFGYRFVGRVEEVSESAKGPPISSQADADPQRAMLQWLESCREALERGHRDTFTLRLTHLVRMWTELQKRSATPDSGGSVSLDRPAEPPGRRYAPVRPEPGLRQRVT